MSLDGSFQKSNAQMDSSHNFFKSAFSILEILVVLTEQDFSKIFLCIGKK